MPDTWQSAYDDLKEFVGKNPKIEIETNAVCIPSDVRPEFYRRFDAVRLRFIKDNYAEMLEKSYAIARLWNETSRLALDDIKLDSIETDPDISWFLIDQNDGLIRFLFDPLFDLLKGKFDPYTFELAASGVLERAFDNFLQEVYKYWTIISLLKLISTDKLYAVPGTELDKDPYAHMETLAAIEGIVEKCPEPVETKAISFEHKLRFSFLQPSAIIHSKTINKFAAFVPDFDYNESRWQSRKLSPDREWYEVSEISSKFGKGDLWPSFGVYFSDDEKNLVVAADHTRMGQPDVIVEIRAHKNWYGKEGLKSINRHYDVLKPRLGSYVVCLEPAPAAALKELEAEVDPALAGTIRSIHLLDVGYDSNKLIPLVTAFTKENQAVA